MAPNTSRSFENIKPKTAQRKACDFSIKNTKHTINNDTRKIKLLDVVCIGNVSNFLLPQPGNELLFHNARSQLTVYQRYKTNPLDFKKLCECIYESLTKTASSRFILVSKTATNWTIISKAQSLTVIASCFLGIESEKEGSMLLNSHVRNIPSQLTPFIVSTRQSSSEESSLSDETSSEESSLSDEMSSSEDEDERKPAARLSPPIVPENPPLLEESPATGATLKQAEEDSSRQSLLQSAKAGLFRERGSSNNKANETAEFYSLLDDFDLDADLMGSFDDFLLDASFLDNDGNADMEIVDRRINDLATDDC